MLCAIWGGDNLVNPQLEEGHIRIANELYDEILRRNFTKRQQNLVLFIWRLSYGTGQKDCLIKQYNHFELAGIYRSDVKKELKYLKECSVLNWDEKNMIFSINKNYKLWQISPNKNWDSDRFNSLIHENIMRKNVSKSLTKDTKKVSETLTSNETEVSKSLTTKNDRVSKSLTKTDEEVSNSLTPELVKHQQAPLEKSSTSRDTEILYPLLKTSFKDINNNNPSYKQQSASQFYEENGFGMLGGYSAEMMIKWLGKFDDEVLILAMKEAIENDAKNWRYLNRILDDWESQGVKSVDDAKAAIAKFRDQFKRRYNGHQTQEEIIPDWFKDRHKNKQNQVNKNKKNEEERKKIAELIQKYS